MRTLRAGPLSLIFEDASGSVRRLSFAGHEAVRRIYPAVRDRHWNTLPIKVWDVEVNAGPDAFTATYLARCTKGEIDFVWKALITGDARGTLTFRLEGQARSDFPRNRAGFCVLHPSRTCAGLPAAVESADGGLRRGTFPRYIYPHPPFTNFNKVWYAPAPGLKVLVTLEGDVFEMEDQRNWTDASFKTYSTPSSVAPPRPPPHGRGKNPTRHRRSRGPPRSRSSPWTPAPRGRSPASASASPATASACARPSSTASAPSAPPTSAPISSSRRWIGPTSSAARPRRRRPSAPPSSSRCTSDRRGRAAPSARPSRPSRCRSPGSSWSRTAFP